MQQQNLVLILARELADKLASATFVVDHEGSLVYFNERAAEILGVTFGEAGHLPMERWTGDFAPTDFDDRPLPPEELPLVLALQKHQPAHRAIRIKSANGEPRDIAITAIPLFAHAEHFVGAVAIFWEKDEAATPVGEDG